MQRAPHWRRVQALASYEGFTLLELLVALTLLGLVFALLAGSVRFGATVWERGGARATQTENLQLTHRVLRRQVEQMRPVLLPEKRRNRNLAVSGLQDRFLFVAPPPASASGQGLQLFRIAFETGAKNLRLVLAWRQIQPDFSDFTDAREFESRILIENIESGQISYFGKTRQQDTALWHSEWVEQKSLPQLVKIALHYPAGDPRRWPLLIIAPKANPIR